MFVKKIVGRVTVAKELAPHLQNESSLWRAVSRRENSPKGRSEANQVNEQNRKKNHIP